MAPLKQPPRLSEHVLGYVQDWVIRLVIPISDKDYDGMLGKEDMKVIEAVRDYVEPWLPNTVASTIIEKIFYEPAYHTAMKFAALQVRAR